MRFLIPALLLGIQSIAQPVRPVPYSLAIGDTIPALSFPVSPSVSAPVDFATLRGKLTILDFWGLSCYSCIAAMPVMDSLQKIFKDRLQIVMVTPDSTAAIDKFFGRGKVKVPSLPMISSDTILCRYFPFESLPHHIWINEKGVVIYITGGENTNLAALNAYFEGQELGFTNHAVLANYDRSQPLWKEGGGRLAHHVQFYSLVSDFLTEHPYFELKISQSKAGVTGFKFLNVPLLYLYKRAYGGLREFGELAQDNRILIEVADQNALEIPEQLHLDRWLRSHSYGYEAVTPPLKEIDFCKMMQEDLARYFPYDVTIEKRKRDVVVLQRIGDSKLNNSKVVLGSQAMEPVIDTAHHSILLDHSLSTTLSRLLKPIVEKEGLIFVDDTGSSIIDHLLLPYPVTDWRKMSGKLAKHGFRLVRKKMFVDMLVIRDKPVAPVNGTTTATTGFFQ